SEIKLIGVIFESLSDSFGAKLLKGIELACNQNGYAVIIKFSNNSNTIEGECIDALMQIPVDGIILLCACSETYNQRILELSLASFPVVFVDRYLPGIPIPYVGIDHKTACKELTDKMFDKGHTSLALVMCDKAAIMTSAIERIRGYKSSCEAHNSLSGNHRLIIPGDANMSVPEEQLNDAISQMIVFFEENEDITGVVTLSDGIAQVLFVALARLKKERNRDIEVAFFDATSHYHFFQSPAFAIRQDETAMGMVSVETLLNVIKHNKTDKAYFTPYHLDVF
ncbi:MAG TPA: substrate-binding domain-containing protein, partial [Alphaproteobacteria bacterium]|nr:substrate-binding domain-containing protein [Alphaproteobacteria bacterium]